MSEELNLKLMAEFDPRLANVWAAIIRAGMSKEDLAENVAGFLRMAYLQGYEDALSEPSRGSLYRSLGIPMPERARQTPRRRRYPQ